ncbi:MAG: hypothetical protein K8R74_17950 [Bacteroidales bacterium]|nr:hypothetical protein [Bacteroidales bacterium]
MIKYCITIILLLLSMLSFGKSNFAEGYIVTLNQDTIYGSFKLKTYKNKKLIYSKTQEKIVFYNQDGKRTVYEAGAIKSFYFFYDFETLTFKTVPYFKKGKLFMKVISEKGNLNLYQFYPDSEKRLSSVYELAEYAYSLGGGGFGEKYFFYIIKPDGTILLMGKHTPKQRIYSFFADYYELAEKIDSREYKYTDVYRMVREYNAWKQVEAETINSGTE